MYNEEKVTTEQTEAEKSYRKINLAWLAAKGDGTRIKSLLVLAEKLKTEEPSSLYKRAV